MQRLLGWWLFDAERTAISRKTSGQTVRFIGRLTCDDINITTSSNRTWAHFLYEDRETQFPVAVEWRNVPLDKADLVHSIVWRVDYLRSAVLWRKKANTSLTHPDYGLWRRVDDFLTDALACWPPHPKTGLKPRMVALNGGWLNGAWTDGYYRCVHGSKTGFHATDPFQKTELTPLTQKPPAPWIAAESNASDIQHVIDNWRIAREKTRAQVRASMQRRLSHDRGPKPHSGRAARRQANL